MNISSLDESEKDNAVLVDEDQNFREVEGLPVVDGRKPVVKGSYLYFLDCEKYKGFKPEEIDIDGLLQDLEKDK